MVTIGELTKGQWNMQNITINEAKQKVQQLIDQSKMSPSAAADAIAKTYKIALPGKEPATISNTSVHNFWKYGANKPGGIEWKERLKTKRQRAVRTTPGTVARLIGSIDEVIGTSMSSDLKLRVIKTIIQEYR